MFLIIFGNFRLKINFCFGVIDCHLSAFMKSKKKKELKEKSGCTNCLAMTYLLKAIFFSFRE